MKILVIFSFGFMTLLNSCTLAPLLCLLNLEEYETTVHFNMSKEKLKNQLVDSYGYKKSLVSKNLGSTSIENKQVNAEHRKSIDLWLDKKKWKELKTDVRKNTTDTLELMIAKHHSRKLTSFTAIISGDDTHSSITIKDVAYQRRNICEEDAEKIFLSLPKKIERKFLKKLKD